MRLPYAFAFACATAVGLLAAGCDDGPSGFVTMGMPGIPSPARIGANLVLAQVDVNRQRGPLMLVDTGSPFTLIDPGDYPSTTFPATAEVKVDLSFGQFTVDGVPALQTTFLTDGTFFIPSIVGGNVLRQFSTELDYRGMQLRLGEGAAPSGVEQPGGTATFVLEGAGIFRIDTTTLVVAPATRVPVMVDVEGVSRPFILDTGASEVAVRSSAYATLTMDGRAQLTGLPISTATGPTTASVTRARTITVAGQTVTNAPVMTIGDDLIDHLQDEVKHPVDGLLGGSFLREFLVTIDYPRGVLHLRRYSPPVTILDEFKRVGVELGPGSGAHRYGVAVVYAGTDAQRQQLATGDELVSIDGVSLDTLDAIAADAALAGAVGTTKQIALGVTALPQLSNTTVGVLVDDLIPAP